MNFKRNIAGAISAFALLTAVNVNVNAKPVTDADIANDPNNTSEVLTYGVGTQGQRFSQLFIIAILTGEPRGACQATASCALHARRRIPPGCKESPRAVPPTSPRPPSSPGAPQACSGGSAAAAATTTR